MEDAQISTVIDTYCCTAQQVCKWAKAIQAAATCDAYCVCAQTLMLELSPHHVADVCVRESENNHLAVPEGVATSLRAAAVLLLLPSSVRTACISPSRLVMPCIKQRSIIWHATSMVLWPRHAHTSAYVLLVV